MSNSDAAAVREIFERNVFHRSATQSVAKPSVMNDATVAGVDAVVAVQRARSDEVTGESGFFANTEERIACGEPLVTALNAECIVGPEVHTVCGELGSYCIGSSVASVVAAERRMVTETSGFGRKWQCPSVDSPLASMARTPASADVPSASASSLIAQ